jgi:hypothetical protein
LAIKTGTKNNSLLSKDFALKFFFAILYCYRNSLRTKAASEPNFLVSMYSMAGK